MTGLMRPHAGRGVATFASALVLAILTLGPSGCGSSDTGPEGTPPAASPTASPTASSVPIVCTPTKPDGNGPPGEPASSLYYGSGGLRTVLWPRGTIVFEPGGPGEIRPDGSLVMKVPFWRDEGVVGNLVITGRSLHREGLGMTGEVPEGSGGEGFQASALVFPEPGCWEVTATAGSASMTFVTEVVRRQ
jgi:hypothetical protein